MAHRIAAECRRVILSADAMLVYRGMDIGTAKPTAAERAEVKYIGLDLADPSESFSAGAWLEQVKPLLPCEPVIVAGGTGLYIKALLQGLDAEIPAIPGLRAKLEMILTERGIAALQNKLRDDFPEWFEFVRDRENPRRLIRAYELASGGARVPSAIRRKPVRITGLCMDRDALNKRIAQRVEFMYQNGLLDEMRRLQTEYPGLSETASHAIGYAEAAAVLAGKMKLAEAKDLTALRTRQLAKRQMTWFRNQADAEWIDVKPGMDPGEIAEQVQRAWTASGPVRFSV